MSGQPCGCDPEARHICDAHEREARIDGVCGLAIYETGTGDTFACQLPRGHRHDHIYKRIDVIAEQDRYAGLASRVDESSNTNMDGIDRIDPMAIEAAEAVSFQLAFERIAGRVYKTAVSKGWWEGERNEGELIALMHSELSEALEGLRHGNPASDKIPAFSAVEEEFADTIIRIMDLSAKRGYRVGEAIIAKMAYNATRSYKHGGKKF